MEVPRDLTHDLVSRVWQEYADDCFTHDREPCVIRYARELVHPEEKVLAVTASTS